MKRVLVLDANQRSALAVTRSLGRQGVAVVTADETSASLAGASRYASQHFAYPSPQQQPDLFVDAIGELVKSHHFDIIMPMTELTTTLLQSNENRLHGAILPFADIDTVNSVADKCALMQAAERLGVPVPKTHYADNTAALADALDSFSYPLVLKPGKSWQQTDGKWDRAAVRIAENPAAASDILEQQASFQHHPFLLQECVSGQGAGVFALYDHGRPLAFFSHRRLREKPPEGGVSVLSESALVEPLLLAHARTLLDDANWHGVAMVEFKVAADGTPYLMEINTRFWGSLQLAVDAGVDFPWLLYQLACGEQPDATGEYRTGIRLRWLLGDLDNLYLTLRNPQLAFATRLAAILGFVTPSLRRTRHEVNRWSDPSPAWYELKQYLRDLLN
jgi:predicted ATP-grasp superfamily ATP-dependent carboligase